MVGTEGPKTENGGAAAAEGPVAGGPDTAEQRRRRKEENVRGKRRRRRKVDECGQSEERGIWRIEKEQVKRGRTKSDRGRRRE